MLAKNFIQFLNAEFNADCKIKILDLEHYLNMSKYYFAYTLRDNYIIKQRRAEKIKKLSLTALFTRVVQILIDILILIFFLLIKRIWSHHL